MGFDISQLKKYKPLLERGIMLEYAPQMAQGALVEILDVIGLDIKTASEWVEKDFCLWDSLDPKYQHVLINLRTKLGDLDWLTGTWIINAIRKEKPALASLFLGWVKGGNWLEKQAGIIREKTIT